jgi:hypothetical protein
MTPKDLKDLTPEEMDLSSRIFDLVLGRVLKAVYLGFDEAGRKNMATIFLSDDETQKEKFIKKHKADFKNIFTEEAKKIEKEIELEIENQF